MKKEEFIERRGEAAYEKLLERNRAWREAHPEKVREQNQARYEEHPEEAKTHNHEVCTKGGKHYDKHVIYNRTGLQGAKNIIRATHRRQYRRYKKIIAPESQLHHQWIPRTADYTGLALVEVNPHRYGIIDVIKIFEGEITLFTEEEIRNHGRGGRC